LAITIVAGISVCALLMIKAGRGVWGRNETSLIEFSGRYRRGPKVISSEGKTTWEVGYDVEFSPSEKLLVVAELYQQDRPMQPLGTRVFTGSTGTGMMTVSFDRSYKNGSKTFVCHSGRIQLGNQVFEIPEFIVDTDGYLSGEGVGWFRGGALRGPQGRGTTQEGANYTELFSFRSAGKGGTRIWVPGAGVSSSTDYLVAVNMVPLSQFKYLEVKPAAGCQGLDGRIIPAGLSHELSSETAVRYKQHLMTALDQE
jgi:hypothetical protein